MAKVKGCGMGRGSDEKKKRSKRASVEWSVVFITMRRGERERVEEGRKEEGRKGKERKGEKNEVKKKEMMVKGHGAMVNRNRIK